MEISLIIILFGLAFVCEYIDCAFGMGYGTLMSPILLIFGFTLSVIVPVLLLSQMCAGISACIFHHKFKNAEFKVNTKDTKMALFFALIGGIAMTFAIMMVLTIPNIFLMFYVGISIFTIGIILLAGKRISFNNKRLVMMGGFGAFNKAISGGGFGPIITSGQIINGSNAKNAVAVTSFAETLLSAFGFILYVLISGFFDFKLALVVVISGIMAAPFGALKIKKLNEKNSRKIIGITILGLGFLTMVKCFL